VLFGDANPGGKLTVTWPRNGGQEPLYYAHNLTFEPETDPNTNHKTRFLAPARASAIFGQNCK